MKTKLHLYLMLILSASFLVNCKDDEPTNTIPPVVVKKYFITTIARNSILKEEFTYNTDNKIIKWQAPDTAGTPYCDFAYNSSGVLTDLTLYSNTLYYGSVFVEMNSSNNPSKVIKYTLVDTTTLVFEYNTGGNLTKINYYRGPDISGQNYGYMVLTYDGTGNITKQIFYDLPDVLSSMQFDYMYDSKKSPFYYTELKWPYFILMLFYDASENVSYLLSKNNVVKNTTTKPAPVNIVNSSYIYNTDGYPIQVNQGTDVYNIEYIVK